MSKSVPAVFRPRRPGDPAELYADPVKAREHLGFVPELSDIDTIVRTAAPFFGLESTASTLPMPTAKRRRSAAPDTPNASESNTSSQSW